MSEKTLGQIAYEMYPLEPWEKLSAYTQKKYEYMVQAVIAEVERRNAAAERPTDEEAAMWRSGATVHVIKAYRARGKCTLKEAYTAPKGLAAPPEAANDPA